METNGRSGSGAAVLVTGCSSGIGRATAILLAEQGFTVFAGVRRSSDEIALERLGIQGLVPVCPLDLAIPGHISSAAARVEQELAERGKNGLFAIVNNAGGGFIAPIELLDLEKLTIELAARLVGPIGLAQALLPSVRKAGGRILWIATPALMPIRFVSSIHACDFAANCIARTLGVELAPWKIPSIFIRCGGIRTAAPAKNDRDLQDAMERWPEDRRALYADALAREMESLAAFDEKRTDPAVVARTVLQALRAKRPRRVYRVGHLSRTAAALELLPQALVDWIMSRR